MHFKFFVRGDILINAPQNFARDMRISHKCILHLSNFRKRKHLTWPLTQTTAVGENMLQNHRIGEIVTHEFGKEKDKLNLFCLRQLPHITARRAFHRSSTPIGSPTPLVWDGDIEIDNNSCWARWFFLLGGYESREEDVAGAGRDARRRCRCITVIGSWWYNVRWKAVLSDDKLVLTIDLVIKTTMVKGYHSTNSYYSCEVMWIIESGLAIDTFELM